MITECREPITCDVDVCPHCDCDNIFENWDFEKNGFVGTCWNCGKEVMLCDACIHADDNRARKCDWSEHYNKQTHKMETMCFRKKWTLEKLKGVV